MKSISVNFSFMDVGTSRISYILFSENGLFRVKREGFQPTILKMNMNESIEFIISDIRNLRAVSYFNSNPNEDLQILAYIEKEDKINLPLIYKEYLDKIALKIESGIADFIVLSREGKSFLSNNTINFDNLFKLDLEEIKDILRNARP